MTGLTLRPFGLSQESIQVAAFPGELMLRLLKMLVLPLVAGSMVAGKPYYLYLISSAPQLDPGRDVKQRRLPFTPGTHSTMQCLPEDSGLIVIAQLQNASFAIISSYIMLQLYCSLVCRSLLLEERLLFLTQPLQRLKLREIAGVCALRGSTASVAKVARYTLCYYAATTITAVILGILLVNIIQPGRGDSLGKEGSSGCGGQVTEASPGTSPSRQPQKL